MIIYWAEGYILYGKTEKLLVARKEIGLDGNADKTKDKVMSRDQNARQSHNIDICSWFFERVDQFRYLGGNLRIPCSVQEEIKNRLKSASAFYYSEQNLLSPIL
jgi:hypothetical protein